MTSAWQWGTVFEEIRPGAGFKTGDFVKEEGVGGARYRRTTDVYPKKAKQAKGNGVPSVEEGVIKST